MVTFLPAPTGPTSGAELVALIENITNWFFAGFMVLAAAFIVLAGWQFIASRGDPTAVTSARAKLLWAAVGIAAAVMAKGIVTAVKSIIGG
jgi:hypothetical protein